MGVQSTPDAASPSDPGEPTELTGQTAPTYNASGVTVGAARPSLPVVWYRAIRPFSFTASIIPVLVGGACALFVGGFSPLAFVLCLGGGMALQAGTNLTNDYYDHWM